MKTSRFFKRMAPLGLLVLAPLLWGDDTTAPSTSTLTAVSGSMTGKVDLSWSSAGDDDTVGNLTGNYRLQYATYSATWDTGSTPTNATTLTISTADATPGVAISTTISGLTPGATYYFGMFTGDEVPNWSAVSNTASSVAQSSVTVTEALGQPGWIGQGETQRILGISQVVADHSLGVNISSVSVQESGGYTADSNLTNVEVWVSSSGFIDGNAIRLENTAKAFSSDAVAFTQDVSVSTTPLYFIVRCDVIGSAAEGSFDISLQVHTSAVTVNNPIAFANATAVVAPPSGAPTGLNASADANLLRINLSWDASTGVDNYLIYRASHSGVATTDYLVGFSSTTSFVDDFVPPNQQVFYSLIGANRAGKSGASSADDATSAAVSALTTSNVYLRAGVHGGYGNGGAAYSKSLSSPRSTFVDRSGNIFIAETNNHRIRFVPQVSGTYFGQAMAASRIYTVAGNSTSGYLADNTAATGTRINSPSGVAVDAGGNIYIADTSNHRIRFVPTSGGTYFGQVMTANYIYTIAGNGTGGYLADGVAATSTRINGPYGLSVDVDGNVYIGDRSNHRIRFVPRNGGTYFGQAMTANYIYTIAGNGTGGYVADNVAATNTQINTPTGVSVGPAGEVYIADTTNSRIRLVPKTAGSYFGQTMSANYIYTIAGNGTAGYLADNVAATSTRINVPNGVSVDAWGNVCVTDAGNYRVRIVARTSATFFGQSMTANRIYSIAGNGSAGYLADNVAGTSTRLNTAYSSSADARGNVYISDTSNGRIRFVPNVNGTYFGIASTAGYIYTFAGNGTAGYLADGVLATSALLNAPAGVFMDAQGNLYIADGTNNRVRFVPKTGGSYFGQTMAANCIYTIAGNGTAGYLADNVAATSTRVNAPGNVHVDSEGNVCFADYSNHRVRFVPKANGTYFGQSMTANYIYTIAGNGTGGYLADGVAATSTRINNPATARMDADGNVYIADYLNTRIRFVPRVTGTYFGQSMTADYIYTIAGNGTSGYLSDNVAATNTRISRPASVNVDAGGNVYIADYFSNHRVRFVPRTSGTYFGQSMTANYIYTIAGNGTAGYLADNVAATNTRINSPYDVSPDAGGNVYIADFANNRIRFVPKASGTYFGQTMTANYIYTIGGTGTAGYDGENAASTGKTINQPSNVFVSSEHVAYFTDLGNNKIRMIAASDFIAPSTSTLTASHGTSDGTVDLTWTSAGDDNVHLGNLTGDYRIQYATYSAAWSAGSTPANATTLTISTTNAVPGVAVSTTISGLTDGVLYYFALFTADEVPNWSDVSNTASSLPSLTLTLAEAAGQPGWIGQGETQRILGTAQVVSDSAAGVTISSVSLQSTGYTADGNLTNVEVWLSSSGYIDATAIRLESTAKAFSSNVVTFTQDVTISTTPCYLVARADVAGGATEGAFELTLQVHTTAFTVNNPVAFSNATDIVAPPSGAPSDLSATASGTLLRVSLSWAAGTGADVYTIYRATHSGVDTTDDMLGTTNTTSFVDDDIPPAQLMYYRVYGVNRAGYSGASNEASATSVDVGALTTSNVYGRAGFPVGLGDGTWATQQAITSMKGVYSDTVGHLYIVDNSSSKIKFVPRMSGTYFGQSMEAFHMYVIAGGGGSLGDGGPATSGKLVTPSGVTVDSAGNVYIADTAQNLIRFIPKTGGTYFGQAMTANYIYSIAGGGGSLGDGGAATSGKLLLPNAVSVDAAGNVFIADKSQHRIRFVPRTSGTYFGQAMTANYIYTIAGNGTGTYGGDSAAATAGQINNITGVAVDAGGNVYIADTGNHSIRFVARTSGTYFGSARTANYIYTIGGNGTGGYGGDDGAATSANIFSPASVSLDADGNVYIADSMNNRIRMIAKMSGTYFGQSMTANYIYTIAGTGTAGYSGDGGAATSGKINSPYGVSVDDGGNVFVGETTNSLVRFVAKTTGVYFGRSRTANSIYTIAGYPGTTFDGEGGSATSGRFSGPEGASVDAEGNLYIADTNNNRVRFVPKIGGTYFGQTMLANHVYTIAGDGTGSYGGDGGAATSAQLHPKAAIADAEGNVIIADRENTRIRFIPKVSGTYFGQSMTANDIYTIAGNGNWGSTGDDGIATSAEIGGPYDLSLDSLGNIYFVDSNNGRLRMIAKISGTYFGQAMTANFVYTLAGGGGSLGDGGPATSAQLSSTSGVGVDARGNVYVADTNVHRIRMIAKTTGTYFGQAMTANYIYTIAGTGTGGFVADNVAASSAQVYLPKGVSVDAGGNVYVGDTQNNRIRFIPSRSGTYFGQSMTANYIYTIGGAGGTTYDGENAVATGKNMVSPRGVFAGPDHMVYLTDYNRKIRMIAGEDFIAPSTSTLAVTAGVEEATLSWESAGDDNVNLGDLTGTYRIQYATFTAAWSTSSTPTDATTVTIATTSVTPGSARSYTVTGLTAGPTYYFVLWTGDEVPNWSDISNTTSTIALAPIRSVAIISGNFQAFGSMMMGDQVVGTTGTVILNDGTLLNTYSLRASTLTAGSPWEILGSTPAAPNGLVFYGVFDGDSAPILGNFDVDDVIGPENRNSTSAQFSVAGSTTGVSVPAGETRTLWIRLDAPTTTTTLEEQVLRIEITAQPP